MSTECSPRPLPRNAIVSVRGVSFHQEAALGLVEGDLVRIAHDRTNPHDPLACAISTLDGVLIGHVPRELAGRLAGVHPGGRWSGTVHEVLRQQTCGVRVRVGELTASNVPQTATGPGGALRHRGDGVATFGDVEVTTDGRTDDGGTDDGGTDDVSADTPAGPEVFAASGRLLGTLIEQVGSTVVVSGARAARVSYPSAVVRIASTA